MCKRSLILLISLFTILLTTASPAAIASQQRHFYFGAEFGYGFIKQPDLFSPTGGEPPVPSVARLNFPEKSGFTWRLNFGINFCKYLGLEIGGERLPTLIASGFAANATATFIANTKFYLYDVDMLAKVMIPIIKKLHIITKAGFDFVLTRTVAHVKIPIFSGPIVRVDSVSSETVLRPKIMVGLGYRTSERTLVNVFYTRILANGSFNDVDYIPGINAVTFGFQVLLG